MKDIIKYKEYISTLHYSPEDKVFFGKIEGINDSITFDGKTVDELNIAFKEAVDDYLAICKLNNKIPEKTYKGSFNVRISPELHKEAARKATYLGKSLNQFVEDSIREYTIKKINVATIQKSNDETIDDLFDWGITGLSDEDVIESMVGKYYDK